MRGVPLNSHDVVELEMSGGATCVDGEVGRTLDGWVKKNDWKDGIGTWMHFHMYRYTCVYIDTPVYIYI